MADIIDRPSALRRIDNDEELYDEIVALFLEDVPDQLSKLASALQSGKADAVTLHAHSLKSAAANIGAERMREVAMRMEAAAREGDLDQTRSLVPSLESEFDKVKGFFSS